MYSDLRACTTARVKGPFWGGGDCAVSDAIPLAGDSEVGAETVVGQVRKATGGERLLSDGEVEPAIASRRRVEGEIARRSRVVREVIGVCR